MAGADFILEKCFGHCGNKLSEPYPSKDVGRAFGAFYGDLFYRILRLFKSQKCSESACFFQWVNVTALQILNDTGFNRLGIGQFNDAHGRGFKSGQMRRSIAPRSGNDLEMVVYGPHDKRRKNALRFD